jgi:hypothetical protein
MAEAQKLTRPGHRNWYNVQGKYTLLSVNDQQLTLPLVANRPLQHGGFYETRLRFRVHKTAEKDAFCERGTRRLH